MALSATFFPAFFGGLYGGLDALRTPADRRAYAAEVARAALAPVAETRPRRGKRKGRR